MAYKNKADQAAYAKKHYENNKDLYKNRAKKFTKIVREENRKYIKDYLSSHPCVDCGNSNVIVLEFDHIKENKLHNVSDMINKGCSLKSIDKEIAKCEVRCANCHRIVTYNRKNNIK